MLFLPGSYWAERGEAAAVVWRQRGRSKAPRRVQQPPGRRCVACDRNYGEQTDIEFVFSFYHMRSIFVTSSSSDVSPGWVARK